jgi:hypothetical protein
VALEAMVIMLAISFTYRLCANSKAMEKLFPADTAGYTTVTVAKYEDYVALSLFLNNFTPDYDESSNSNGFRTYINNIENSVDYVVTDDTVVLEFDAGKISDTLIAALDKMEYQPATIKTNFSKNATQIPATKTQLTNIIKNKNSSTAFKQCYMYLYPKVTVKSALMLLMQIVFPCMLCVGVVKAASTYSGLVVGKG